MRSRASSARTHARTHTHLFSEKTRFSFRGTRVVTLPRVVTPPSYGRLSTRLCSSFDPTCGVFRPELWVTRPDLRRLSAGVGRGSVLAGGSLLVPNLPILSLSLSFFCASVLSGREENRKTRRKHGFLFAHLSHSYPLSFFVVFLCERAQRKRGKQENTEKTRFSFRPPIPLLPSLFLYVFFMFYIFFYSLGIQKEYQKGGPEGGFRRVPEGPSRKKVKRTSKDRLYSPGWVIRTHGV